MKGFIIYVTCGSLNLWVYNPQSQTTDCPCFWKKCPGVSEVAVPGQGGEGGSCVTEVTASL